VRTVYADTFQQVKRQFDAWNARMLPKPPA
jgi:hypothetical protein